MSETTVGQAAIVDYGMGNLFSVKHACEQAGLSALITASPKDIFAADAVILPGVGAFGDAMETLTKLDLVSVLRDFAASPKPLVGICLGMQLLMDESHEFGRHRGLGVIQGEVVNLPVSENGERSVKVPQVGWNQIHLETSDGEHGFREGDDRGLQNSLLDGIGDGEYMYFVHSYYAVPAEAGVVVSTTQYGSMHFCSSLCSGSVFACQFHPERSGQAGLRIYQNLAKLLTEPEPEPVKV